MLDTKFQRKIYSKGLSQVHHRTKTFSYYGQIAILQISKIMFSSVARIIPLIQITKVRRESRSVTDLTHVLTHERFLISHEVRGANDVIFFKKKNYNGANRLKSQCKE